MNYNPCDKENVRQAILAAMYQLNGYNATVRQLNQQLKANPAQAESINADKAYLKHKYSAKGPKSIPENLPIASPNKEQKEPPVINEAPPAIVPPSNNNNNSSNQPSKKSKKIGTKEQVYFGEAEKTSGGLTKDDLILNKQNKVISKKKSEYGKQFAAERLKQYQANKKANVNVEQKDEIPAGESEAEEPEPASQ
jgi:hypothetical protein